MRQQAVAYRQNLEPVSSGSSVSIALTPKPLGTSGSYSEPAPIVDEFSDYSGYETADWDGYGADPITPATVAAARSLQRLLDREIPAADIAPGADGTIGFEWRSGSSGSRTRIVFEVGPSERLVVRQIDPNGVEKKYGPTTVTVGGRALISQLLTS
jgi:hypothetical protein